MRESAPSPAPPRASRTDGIEARKRLLYAALALFAEKGFAKTSTREIAAAAGTNIASISYYFGDKAGLYAATFTEPMGGAMPDFIAMYEAPELPIAEALRIFMAGYLLLFLLNFLTHSFAAKGQLFFLNKRRFLRLFAANALILLPHFIAYSILTGMGVK